MNTRCLITFEEFRVNQSLSVCVCGSGERGRFCLVWVGVKKKGPRGVLNGGMTGDGCMEKRQMEEREH